MRRRMFGSTGRRGTVIATSAAALCLGSALTACGGPGGDGYTAVGAAGTGSAQAQDGAAPPSGAVALVPLDGPAEAPGPGSGERSASPAGSARDGATDSPALPGSGDGSGTARPPSADGLPGPTTSGSPRSPGSPESKGGSGGGGGGGGGGRPVPPGGTPGDTTPPTPSTPGSTPPAPPASIEPVSLVRTPVDKRWCEQVTVAFRNTGGTPARSGTVTFGTHIIGGLGVDWATVWSTQPLPTPIGAGAVRKKAYTVCVDAWRVPLGMRVETQDVTAIGK